MCGLLTLSGFSGIKQQWRANEEVVAGMKGFSAGHCRLQRNNAITIKQALAGRLCFRAEIIFPGHDDRRLKKNPYNILKSLPKTSDRCHGKSLFTSLWEIREISTKLVLSIKSSVSDFIQILCCGFYLGFEVLIMLN